MKCHMTHRDGCWQPRWSAMTHRDGCWQLRSSATWHIVTAVDSRDEVSQNMSWNFCLHLFLYLLVSWARWDWPLTWLTYHHPSVLCHCLLGYLTRKIVSKMTYNVSSWMLHLAIPNYTLNLLDWSLLLSRSDIKWLVFHIDRSLLAIGMNSVPLTTVVPLLLMHVLLMLHIHKLLHLLSPLAEFLLVICEGCAT